MWRAKQVSWDTYCCFEGQRFVGAGVNETLQFLALAEASEISAYILGIKECGQLDDLTDWENWKTGYYYADIA